MTVDRQHKGRRAVFPMDRLKLAQADASGKRSFQGYAAVFGNRDAHSDIIVKGAFAKSLQENPGLKVLWQHDKPIGLGSGYEDDYGLSVTGVLSNTDLVKGEVVPLLEDGVVNGLSIGYDVVVEERNDNLDAWLLKEIDLFEFSPVTFPANELATVTVVKELDSRKDGHTASVERHAKSLIHLFEGYFQESDRREALDFDPLRKLHALLGGTLPGEQPTAAHAADDEALKFAYLQGGIDALELAHSKE